MKKDDASEPRRRTALAFMLAAQVFSVLMNVSTRLLETRRSQLGALQILSVRMVLTAVLLLLYLAKSNIPNALLGPKEVRPFLIIRGLGGFIGVFGLYYSLAQLNLSEASAMMFLTPFGTSILCYLFLGESFAFVELGSCVVSFLGVIIITRPPLSIFSDEFLSVVRKKHSVEGTAARANRKMAFFVGLLGVLSSAGALTAVRRIGTAAHPLTSVNYFVVCSAALSVSALFIFPGQKTSISSMEPGEWGLLFTASLFGLLMQISMTISLQLDKASRATSMMFMQLVFAIGADKVIFGYDPDVGDISGMSLILLSVIFVGARVARVPTNRSEV